MKKFFRRIFYLFLALAVLYLVKYFYLDAAKVWKLPLKTTDRQDLSAIYLEPDAGFKARRPSYDGIPVHLHTGVDLQINAPGGPGEPIYAIAAGQVVQIADQPPLRRIVIKHKLLRGGFVWSVYLHVIDEKVAVGDRVTAETVIARRLNKYELDYFGWKYNHLHLEIMKSPPLSVTDALRRKSYICRTEEEVDRYFVDPLLFFRAHLPKKYGRTSR
ncbi:MAG: M23 family metallopeptidase [Calditrichaeota bacterium]|nr:M23 family metallopeptidase [Calditrichota bacterium]